MTELAVHGTESLRIFGYGCVGNVSFAHGRIAQGGSDSILADQPFILAALQTTLSLSGSRPVVPESATAESGVRDRESSRPTLAYDNAIADAVAYRVELTDGRTSEQISLRDDELKKRTNGPAWSRSSGSRDEVSRPDNSPFVKALRARFGVEPGGSVETVTQAPTTRAREPHWPLHILSAGPDTCGHLLHVVETRDEGTLMAASIGIDRDFPSINALTVAAVGSWFAKANGTIATERSIGFVIAEYHRP